MAQSLPWDAAEQLVSDRLKEVRRLSFENVSSLSEATDEEIVIDDRKYYLTTFVQAFNEDQLLVTLQFTRPTWFGLAGIGFERGIVFSQNGEGRDATLDELISSGG